MLSWCRRHKEGNILPWALHLQETELSEIQICQGSPQCQAWFIMPAYVSFCECSHRLWRRPYGLASTLSQCGTRGKFLPLWLWGLGTWGASPPFLGLWCQHQDWTPLVHCLLGHPGNILALIGSLGVWGPGSYAFDGLQPQLEWGNLPDKQAMTPSPWEAMGFVG